MASIQRRTSAKSNKMAFPSSTRKSNTPSATSSSSAFGFSSPRPIHSFRNSTTQPVRYRATSPNRSISSVQFVRKYGKASSGKEKRMCMCSPTNHPGSFRCSFHKNNSNHSSSSSSHHHPLKARRSAMTNSMVRIGTVEGDLVKCALATLIRPSSHNQRKHSAFLARPSRLSVMSRAKENDAHI